MRRIQFLKVFLLRIKVLWRRSKIGFNVEKLQFLFFQSRNGSLEKWTHGSVFWSTFSLLKVKENNCEILLIGVSHCDTIYNGWLLLLLAFKMRETKRRGHVTNHWAIYNNVPRKWDNYVTIENSGVLSLVETEEFSCN